VERVEIVSEWSERNVKEYSPVYPSVLPRIIITTTTTSSPLPLPHSTQHSPSYQPTTDYYAERVHSNISALPLCLNLNGMLLFRCDQL